MQTNNIRTPIAWKSAFSSRLIIPKGIARIATMSRYTRKSMTGVLTITSVRVAQIRTLALIFLSKNIIIIIIEKRDTKIPS